jgi:hypothetical protein
MIAFLLLSLIACDEKTDTQGASGVAVSTWSHIYGQCGNLEQAIISAEDLGSPIAYFIEVEGPNGWMPLALTASDMEAPLIVRNEDTGLWLTCPNGTWSYHVSWVR